MSVASWCNIFFSESKVCLSVVSITGWDPNVQCVVCPVKCEITVNRLFSVTETLDENFSFENFSHLQFFFAEEFQNEILTKIFHNENFKSEI